MESCEKDETVCMRGLVVERHRGDTRGEKHGQLSVCTVYFCFFLEYKHNSKPGIAVESIEKHV